MSRNLPENAYNYSRAWQQLRAELVEIANRDQSENRDFILYVLSRIDRIEQDLLPVTPAMRAALSRLRDPVIVHHYDEYGRAVVVNGYGITHQTAEGLVRRRLAEFVDPPEGQLWALRRT